MTRREFFETVMTIMSDIADFEPYATNPIRDEIFAQCEKELAKMDERNAKRAETPSKKSVENKPIMESIENFLANCEDAKIASDIVAEVGYSVQKISSLCKQMVEEGRLVSEDVKIKGKGVRKAYKIAE